MKLAALILLFVGNTFAYQCSDYTNDAKKVETLNFVATEVLGYVDMTDFCENDKYMDLQLSFMPNYFKYQEEDDDHYKLMVHYAYSSCTFIYNITRKKISDKSCYSTW